MTSTTHVVRHRGSSSLTAENRGRPITQQRFRTGFLAGLFDNNRHSRVFGRG